MRNPFPTPDGCPGGADLRSATSTRRRTLKSARSACIPCSCSANEPKYNCINRCDWFAVATRSRASITRIKLLPPCIAAQVWAALGDARTVLNVGAGTGSYEPPDRHVLAVEPSALMRSQRLPDAAPCLVGSAENLPFDDQSFDAAMAFATVHHWQDPIAGLREMRRVARRVVVFTHDTSDTGWLRRFWLTRDYLPEVADLLVGRPSVTELARAIEARMEPVLIPWDCTDGFSTRQNLAYACWSPEAATARHFAVRARRPRPRLPWAGQIGDRRGSRQRTRSAQFLTTSSQNFCHAACPRASPKRETVWCRWMGEGLMLDV
jgi:SAM-dependent methyltransferase